MDSRFSEDDTNVSRFSAESAMPIFSSRGFSEAAYPSRFEANVLTLSISSGIRIIIAKIRMSSTSRNVRKFARPSLTFSGRTFANRVFRRNRASGCTR